jgi:hypothetical protein
MSYYNGYIKLNNGKCVDAHLHESCASAKACMCGFCKGVGQCQWGDCHDALPTNGAVGTLCLKHSEMGYGRFAGHRASVAA